MSTDLTDLTIQYTTFIGQGATMTIKGSLQVSIPIVEAFLTRNFLRPVKNWPKICVFGGKWGRNVKCCILDTKRHILARNDVI